MADVRYALRVLARAPGFAAVAILTIGLAIGANTSIFSVVRGVLLRDLPYENPDQLVIVWANLTARNRPRFPVSPPDLEDLKRHTTTFQDLAGVATGQAPLTAADGPPEQVDIGQVTANFFDVLGVRPVVGRTFVPEDDDPFGPNVDPQAAPSPNVVISHALWQRRFGGSEEAIGKSLYLAGQRATVIGVLPAGFELYIGEGAGLSRSADVWLAPRIDVANWGPRRNVIWRIIGRMKDGVSVEQARADVLRLSDELNTQEEGYRTAGRRLDTFPLIEDLTASVRPILWPLFGAVAVVLLIACANVSNLFLARASAREREFAVRTALGAGRHRLVRQLLVESGVIGLAGAALGLLLAVGGIRLLVALQPADLPRMSSIGIDGTVLGFTLGAGVLSAFLFGLVPALQASRPAYAQVLKDRGRNAVSKGQRLFRSSLVVAQVALSVVLLVGAGLMVRSFAALQHQDLGYDPDGVLTFRVVAAGQRYPLAQRRTFLVEFADRLRALPGVTSVGAATPIPLIDREASARYGPPEALTDGSLFGQAEFRRVERGYFETMHTRLVDGRLFDETEFGSDSALNVLVDRKIADKLWPGRSAVGERLAIRVRSNDPELVHIIGVVEHERAQSTGHDGTEAVYVTNRFVFSGGDLYWLVRASGNLAALVPQVRQVLREMDPDLPIAEVRTMAERVTEAGGAVRFSLVLIGMFGSVALFLAAVGLYGVLAFTVRQRTGEFGVRMALGASAEHVRGLVVRQGMLLTGVGIAVGLVAGFWATRLMGSLLVGVSPTDPGTFLAMTAVLVVAALAACYLPALRATRVDPAVALRAEE